MSLALLALLVLAGIAAGVVAGRFASNMLTRGADDRPSLSRRARNTATSAAVRLWKWRRGRSDV